MENIKIRVATPADAKELLDIYTPYVTGTAITFEYEAPTLEEFKLRIQNISAKYPYLVAEIELNNKANNSGSHKILGYAYANTFKGRAAYDWSVETTIYVRQDMKKNGLGKMLYAALEESLTLQGITNMNACVAYPEIDDEYLTKNSVGFHEHLGFQKVGVFHNCANKFHCWYHMIWLEKMIGAHESNPAPIIPFPNIITQLSFIEH